MTHVFKLEWNSDGAYSLDTKLYLDLVINHQIILSLEVYIRKQLQIVYHFEFAVYFYINN